VSDAVGEPAIEAAGDRRRRWAIGLTAIAVPAVWLSLDVVNRRGLLPLLDDRLLGIYVGGVLASLICWGLGMEAARHPRRAVRWTALGLLFFHAAFGIGGQAYYRAMTHGYVNRAAVLLATGVPAIIRGYTGAHAGAMAASFLVPAFIVAALAILREKRFGARTQRPGAVAAGAAAAMLCTMLVPLPERWYQCLPPDILWLNGSGGPLLLLVGLTKPPPTLPVGVHQEVVASAPAPADAPPVIVLLGESVRADEVCVSRAPDCTKSPRVDEAAPDRIGYPQARSVTSCTDVASSVLWTGLPATADAKSLAHAPLLWDYAKARGYRTAYISSQNLQFEALDFFLSTSRIDLLRESRGRDFNAGMDLGTPDELTTDEAVDFVQKPGGPAFVLVHYANTHAPYRQVPGYQPYPLEGVSDAQRQRNRYRNAIAFNDQVIGDLVAKLRKTEAGRRAIVISLSDHGEAWGLHGSYMHTWDLYGEQIDIPLWIDAPAGSLPDEAIARLRRDAPSRIATTPDVAATVLDLLGVLDDPALGAFTARLAGTSLLRDPPESRDVMLWNCPPTHPCALDSLGVLRWPRKLHYVGREARYGCYDLAADPRENSELPGASCADLRVLLDATFGSRLDLRVRPP
jgi:Sulfatase